MKMNAIYFVGAGGIGMSALIRYFLSQGKAVGGYDRTPTPLTQALIAEGAQIHYEDCPDLIPAAFRSPDDTLVVYTPAIPADHQELQWLRRQGHTVMKRSEVLGLITRHTQALCVAGTHGKTTTSTMAAHLLHESAVGCTAFLGGISKNYGTNLLLSDRSPYSVIEADEFDRSFHHLSPWMSVVTATDPDHLDIYGTVEAYLESFSHYTSLIRPGGALIVHTGLALQPRLQEGVRLYTYSREEGDFHAERIRIGGGEIVFDFVAPDTRIENVHLGVPVGINIENGVAAMALAHLAGASDDDIRRAMQSFRGVDRRFDFRIRTATSALISDYGHHPAEVRQSLLSIRELYPEQKLTVIFQPHLYTRTRDFYPDFADSLSLADEVILTDIYPAREAPIEGVSSRLIFDRLRPGIEKTLCLKNEVADLLRSRQDWQVVVILGAGDLDNQMDEFERILTMKS